MKDLASQSKNEESISVRASQERDNFSGLPHAPHETSNDLLFTLHGVYSPRALNYEIIAQSADEVQDIRNAPALSMGAYLEETGQARLFTSISIYSQLGDGREQIRLLFMNSVAFLIWEAMEKDPRLIGAQHRPPKTALLTFGVPFTE